MRTVAWLVTLLLLAACGGAPFSSIDEFRSDGGSVSEGGGDETESEAGPDAGVDADKPEADGAPGVDAVDSPACTPFTATWGCYNTHDSLTIMAPSQYCLAQGPDVNTAPLSQLPTPAACQCKETYTCACIVANAPTCAQPHCYENGGGITLECP